MALSYENMGPADIAAVVDNNRGYIPYGGFGGNWGGIGNGFGFGGDGMLFLLFLFAMMGGNWGGFGGNGGMIFPWMVGNTTNADVQRGFDQSAVMSGINGLTTNVCNGFAGVNQNLCSGFAGVNANVANGFAQAEIANNARQIADMQQAFAAQTAMANGFNGIGAQLAQCCCENRAAVADLKYTVAQENCEDRYQAANNTRDILAATQAQTQTILDKLCQQENDALKAQNANLQTQLYMANLAASQNAQTAALIQDNNAQTAALINRIAPYPTPSYIVGNPYAAVGCNCGCGAVA